MLHIRLRGVKHKNILVWNYHQGRKKLCNYLSAHLTRWPRMRLSHRHGMTHFNSSTEHLLVISLRDFSDYLSFSAWSDDAIKIRPPLLRPLCDAPSDNSCLRGPITFVYSPPFQTWPPVSAECAAGAVNKFLIARHPVITQLQIRGSSVKLLPHFPCYTLTA